MPRVKTLTDEQLANNHRKSSAAYKKRNPSKQCTYSKTYYDKNKAKISARRKQKRLEKKQLETAEVKYMLKKLRAVAEEE